MAKRPNDRRPIQQSEPAVEPPLPPRQPFPPPRSERTVPKHLQCPVCFNGRGGMGKQKWWKRVSGVTTKQCYSCNQCGHEWTATIKRMPIEIEHMEVEIDSNDGPDMETR